MKLRYVNIYKILTLEKTVHSWKKVMDLSGIGISIETEKMVLYRNQIFSKIRNKIESPKISETTIIAESIKISENLTIPESSKNSKSPKKSKSPKSPGLSCNNYRPIQLKYLIFENLAIKVNQVPIYFANTQSYVYILQDIK
jgi:hypothetical protein